jgi:hypothetical protein
MPDPDVPEHPVAQEPIGQEPVQPEPIDQALAQLRLRLLDLTARNRLLNFRPTPARSIPLLGLPPDDIYRRLLGGEDGDCGPIHLHSVPLPPAAGWPHDAGGLHPPDAAAEARRLGFFDGTYELPTTPSQGPDRWCFQTLHYNDSLNARCRKMSREANSSIDETGANTLFLVVGVLRYLDHPAGEQFLEAPLVSIPVEFQINTHGPWRYRIQRTGEDPQENLSLREKLREHDIEVPLFDPDVDQGLDDYFRRLRACIATRQGWEVKRHATLALLSFTRMLLVRDIDPERWPHAEQDASPLSSHPIVRTILGAPQPLDAREEASDAPSADNEPRRELPLVLDADSSQHKAIIDALDGPTMVIEGPPGTGKSQTITNLIAAAMERGKTVLFVSDKLAALDVVQRNLVKAHLDPFCLELHSQKADRKKLLAEIETRLHQTFPDPGGAGMNLEAMRQRLKEHADLINRVVGNQLELTVHQVLWRALRHQHECGTEWTAVINIRIPNASTASAQDLACSDGALSTVATLFPETYGATHPFWGFRPQAATPNLAGFVQVALEEALPVLDHWVKALEALGGLTGGGWPMIDRDSATRFREVLDSPEVVADDALPTLFTEADPTGQTAGEVLARFAGRLGAHKQAEERSRVVLHAGQLTDADAAHARELLRGLSDIGSAELPAQSLRQRSEKLESAYREVQGALDQLTQLHPERRTPQSDEEIERIAKPIECANRASELPVQNWHPGLGEPNAAGTIDQWKRLSERRRNLDQTLRVKKAAQMQEDLRKAASALEKALWYWPFGRWHALNVHRSIERTKSRKRPTERLLDLQKLRAVFQREEERRPTFERIFGRLWHEGEPRFDDASCLANWAEQTRNAVQQAGLDPASLGLLQDPPNEVPLLAAHGATIEAVRQSLRCCRELAHGTLTLGDRAAWDAANWQDRSRMLLDRSRMLCQAATALDRWASPAVPAKSVIEAVEAAAEARVVATEVAADAAAQRFLGARFRGVQTDLAPVRAALEFGRRVRGAGFPQPVVASLLSDKASFTCQELCRALGAIETGWSEVDRLKDRLGGHGDFDLSVWVGVSHLEATFPERLLRRTRDALAAIGRLVPWAQYLNAARSARGQELGPFVDRLEDGRLSQQNLLSAFRYRFYASIAEALYERCPDLQQFVGLAHGQLRHEFAELDRAIIERRGRQIAHSAAATVPPEGNVDPIAANLTEMALLRHLFTLGLRRVTIRDALNRAGVAIRALKPCFMMSPEAVARFLPSQANLFDFVVMDEASQLKPEEALGAIARGKQLVLVGDPKQLPPTAFFDGLGVVDSDGDGGGVTAAAQAESILDLGLARISTVRRLQWHYRSRHESLIAFSNAYFYKDLVVFPSFSSSSQGRRLGVQSHYLHEARYEHQTNRREAQRVVDAVIDHVLHCSEDSLGVVTLNLKQRDLVDDLLEEHCRDIPAVAEYRRQHREKGMGLFVKNLENVQGDERDVIFVSTTFGPQPGPGPRVVHQNFGPISRSDGWRRLNVLFTRARKAVHVFTALAPEDIVVGPDTPRGTRTLREYLEYARTGILPQDNAAGGEPESDFERAVADMLADAGYDTIPQFGVGRYRVDLVVRDPRRPGAYLAAVECDGARYHSGMSVRDRDRIREGAIGDLGWRGRIWRIWSTDWFRNPQHELHRLVSFLNEKAQEPLAVESVAQEEPSVIQHPEGPTDVTALLLDEDLASIEYPEVVVGSRVRIRFLDETADRTITIAADGGVNAGAGLYGQATPLAQALLGATEGDEVELHVPPHPTRRIRVERIVSRVAGDEGAAALPVDDRVATNAPLPAPVRPAGEQAHPQPQVAGPTVEGFRSKLVPLLREMPARCTMCDGACTLRLKKGKGPVWSCHTPAHDRRLDNQTVKQILDAMGFPCRQAGCTGTLLVKSMTHAGGVTTFLGCSNYGNAQNPCSRTVDWDDL